MSGARVLRATIFASMALGLACLGLVASVPEAAAIGPTITNFYVDGTTGSDANPCTDPGSACLTVGHALNLAQSTGGEVQINVAPGTYPESLTIPPSVSPSWSSMDLVGSGADTTTISANSGIKTSLTVSITGFTVAGTGPGCGIENQDGDLTLYQVAVDASGCVEVGNEPISHDTTLDIESSLITGGSTAATCGGGVCNYGDSGGTAAVTINNSTIYNNSNTSGIGGSGLGNYAFSSAHPATMDITASTIVANTGSAGDPGVWTGTAVALATATTTITDAIVAGNSTSGEADCGSFGPGTNTTTDGGNDLGVTGGGCGFALGNDQNVANFFAAGVSNSLANNGGPTETLALAPSSPAISNGACSPGGTPLTSDQRGAVRPHEAGQVPGKDNTCDMGAFEYAPPVVTAVTPNNGPPAGGNSVKITGVGFTLATALAFGANGVALPGRTDTSITVSAPPGPAGTVDVSVTNPDGTSPAGPADNYTYNAPPPPPPPSGPTVGYDLVGSDGGVFVFPVGQTTGFFGSLPGLSVHVNNIVGIVPTNNFNGYDLVGSDGGVFVFPVGQTTGFFGSLPGLHVTVSNIVGIVPTADDQGYFLVGSDGGVFAFGDAPFENSLPGIGVHVTNIVGIVATADDLGYWLVSASGAVYALGDAPFVGSLGGNSPTPITGIAATPDSKGYWLVGENGSVSAFGDALSFGSLPGLGVSVSNIVSIVPTPSGLGYWLIGSDGGIFAFGDATSQGSLPGLGVQVTNVVGAVPTR